MRQPVGSQKGERPVRGGIFSFLVKLAALSHPEEGKENVSWGKEGVDGAPKLFQKRNDVALKIRHSPSSAASVLAALETQTD